MKTIRLPDLPERGQSTYIQRQPRNEVMTLWDSSDSDPILALRQWLVVRNFAKHRRRVPATGQEEFEPEDFAFE